MDTGPFSSHHSSSDTSFAGGDLDDLFATGGGGDSFSSGHSDFSGSNTGLDNGDYSFASSDMSLWNLQQPMVEGNNGRQQQQQQQQHQAGAGGGGGGGTAGLDWQQATTGSTTGSISSSASSPGYPVPSHSYPNSSTLQQQATFDLSGHSPPFSTSYATTDGSSSLQVFANLYSNNNNTNTTTLDSSIYRQQQPTVVHNQQQYLAPSPPYLTTSSSSASLIAPPQTHSPQSNPSYVAFTPSPSSSSSNNSYHSAPPPPPQTDESLARLIASATAQGRLHAEAQAKAQVQQQQAIAQAAYSNSYLASLQQMQQAQARGGGGGGGQPQFTLTNGGGGGQLPPAYHQGQHDLTNVYLGGGGGGGGGFAQHEVAEVDTKKRRTSGANVEGGGGGSSGGGGSGKRGGGSSASRRNQNGLNGQQQHQQQQQQQQQPMQLNEQARTFDFSLKSSTSSARQQQPSSSVDLIANAGIHGAYQDDFQRYGRSAPAPPSSAAAVTTKGVTKASEKKGATAATTVVAEKGKKGGGEKRKKGEKGHNAVERRYRNNINNHLSSLRDAIPALRHLKPLPSMPASRRRASQFTLSTAAQAPTPAGLIDGIPAAKTLSKGVILGKSIEYITHLQGARADGLEDLELFKQVVLELVGDGQTLVDVFEQRRGVREVERMRVREEERKEQARLDAEEDGGASGEEDEEEENDGTGGAGEKMKIELGNDQDSSSFRNQQQQQPTYSRTSISHQDGLALLRQQHPTSHSSQPIHLDSFMGLGTSGSPNPFPPSPASSSEDVHSISPRLVQSHHYRGHVAGPPRVLLASFMGLSFGGGLAYDWTYNSAGSSTGAGTEGGGGGARAWANKLVRRGAEVIVSEGQATPSTAIPSSALITSDVLNSTLLTGLVFLGFASILAMFIILVYPLLSSSSTTTTFSDSNSKSRAAFRRRRRAQALASLSQLNSDSSSSRSTIPPTYLSECQSALRARRSLLKLVGAPTYGLLPALGKEFLATLLRNVTTIRVGSFSSWSEEDRVETAVAWVRIAEIEATVGAEEINSLARWYTFLRLFNLSRSSHWPSTSSPSTTRPHVNSILSIHLLSLGHPLYAQALWTQATTQDRKKTSDDILLHPWVEIALSTAFAQVKEILSLEVPKDDHQAASTSDTVPLLRISEARCAAALGEAWAKLFVGVVQTTGPLNASVQPSNLLMDHIEVQKEYLEETVDHVLRSTIDGSEVYTLGLVTRSVVEFFTGREEEAKDVARRLKNEGERSGGALKRLACGEAYLRVVLGEDEVPDEVEVEEGDDDEEEEDEDDDTAIAGQEQTSRKKEPIDPVDLLAASTLGWLVVRRRQTTTSPTSSSNLSSPLPASASLPSPSPSPPLSPTTNLNTTSSTLSTSSSSPRIRYESLLIRRMLGVDVASDPGLVAFCEGRELDLDDGDEEKKWRSAWRDWAKLRAGKRVTS